MCDNCSSFEGGGTDPVGKHGAVSTLPLDEVCKLLGDDRRLKLLRYLVEKEEPVADFEELVDVVADADSGGGGEDRTRLRTDLFHNHLPRLEEFDVVECDHRTLLVRYHGDPKLEAVLETLSDTASDPESVVDR